MRPWSLCCAGLLVIAAAGCGGGAPPEASHGDAARWLLAEEPAGAQEVIVARQDAAGGSEVVVVGRIGGSDNPWVEGRAAFSIVDTALKACSDVEGDNCPVPWDYCCATDELPAATALVKFVDDQGRMLPIDARKLLPLKELQTVVVRGQAERDAAGNLTVLAEGIYVRP